MTTGSPTWASVAADVAAKEADLNWKDVTQLLKEKLNTGSFTRTLRYSPEHRHV